jgi:hypothetical protein
MFERSEGQVAHRSLMARQRAEIDLPPGAKPPSHSSAARQELEAAFSPPPPAPVSPDWVTAKGGRAPEVVIKRKRAFAAPPVSPAPRGTNDEARDSPVDCDTLQDAHSRAPRVFRVEAPVLIHGKDSPDSASDALMAGGSSGVDTAIESLPVIPTRRPRRRAAPAVVRFVAHHAAHTAADKPSVAPAIDEVPNVAAVGDAAGTVLSFATDRRFDAVLKRIQRLEPIVRQIREAHDFNLVSRDAKQGKPGKGSYQALRVAIEKLERQAEIARRAEASRAIKWIKRAIGEYGLTSGDLGL